MLSRTHPSHLRHGARGEVLVGPGVAEPSCHRGARGHADDSVEDTRLKRPPVAARPLEAGGRLRLCFVD